MKKIMILALSLGAVASMSAQKATVDAANKLAGKTDKIEEARALIQEAKANPETANEARTYYVGGKIEMDAFDKGTGALMINPNAEVDGIAMGQQLLNAYNNWVKALELDQLPNEKGQVKPKYTKDIKGSLAAHVNDFAKVGADFYNGKKYYPEAYEAFMITGNMPEYGAAMPDTIVATYFGYAGISAFLANEFQAAAEAFKKARLAGAPDADTYVNEISAWRNLADKELVSSEEADKHIWEVAKAGFEKFGLNNSLFLIHMVNHLFNSDQKDEAIKICQDAMAQYPDNGDVAGILANTYERIDDFDNAGKYYRQSIAKDQVSPNILYSAVNYFYRAGSAKNNEIDPNSPDAAAQKAKVRSDYVEPGLQIIERIRTIDPGMSGLDDAQENLEYLEKLAQ